MIRNGRFARVEESGVGWRGREGGRLFDPRADVMSIVGALDSMRTQKDPSKSRLAIEDALAQTVAHLAG
jgi:hypothetical protein